MKFCHIGQQPNDVIVTSVMHVSFQKPPFEFRHFIFMYIERKIFCFKIKNV